MTEKIWLGLPYRNIVVPNCQGFTLFCLVAPWPFGTSQFF